MRKTLTIILLVTAMLVFTSCGKKPANDADVKVLSLDEINELISGTADKKETEDPEDQRSGPAEQTQAENTADNTEENTSEDPAENTPEDPEEISESTITDGDPVIAHAKVIVNELRIRQQPSTNSRILGYAELNKEYDVYEMSGETEDRWLRIGDGMWISGNDKYVSIITVQR